jgi:hypothetical protein
MTTKQEFLENELYREVQNALCNYQLERISVNELVILLADIIKRYDVKLEKSGKEAILSLA